MLLAAGVSYLRSSNEMASILRQCLQEPYRVAAMAKDKTNIMEKIWVNRVVALKTRIEDMKTGFETDMETKKRVVSEHGRCAD